MNFTSRTFRQRWLQRLMVCLKGHIRDEKGVPKSVIECTESSKTKWVLGPWWRFCQTVQSKESMYSIRYKPQQDLEGCESIHAFGSKNVFLCSFFINLKLWSQKTFLPSSLRMSTTKGAGTYRYQYALFLEKKKAQLRGGMKMTLSFTRLSSFFH